MVTIVCIFASAAVIALADRLGKFSTESAKHKSKLSAIDVDNFMNLKTLKFLGKCGYALERHENQLEETYPWYVNSGQMMFHKIGTAVACIPMIVNMYINRHDLEMVTFIAITNGVILNSAGVLIDMVECLIERKASLSIIKNLKGDDIEEYPDVPDKYEINDVEFDYGKDSTHFHINNLSFEKNKRYHVVGESGEGKSSLANLISGSINSTKGYIKPIKTFYVYQETECLDDTLRNNLSFGDPNISDSEIIELIEDLNLMDWFNDLKDGLDTILGERGFKLSSGQKQRINIIRSILRMRENNDEMIILDEITSNLDSDTEKIVVDMIDKECNGTCMIISHHGDFSKICDEQILVKNHTFSQTKLVR